MRAGVTDKYVDIKSVARTKRADGGWDTSWSTLESVWSDIQPASARLVERYARGEQVISHVIVVRQPSLARAGMRVYFGSRIFYVEAAYDPREEGAWWHLVCREDQEPQS